MARPTVPGCADHSSEPTSVTTPPSLAPQYSTSTGPHHSIICRFTLGAIGAAPCNTVVSADGENDARASSDRRSSRTNMVGTRCVLRTSAALDERERLGRVERRHHDHRGPVQQVHDREAERRGVIQRAGDEMRAQAVETEHGAGAAQRGQLGREVVPDDRGARLSVGPWCRTCRSCSRRGLPSGSKAAGEIVGQKVRRARRPASMTGLASGRGAGDLDELPGRRTPPPRRSRRARRRSRPPWRASSPA